MVRHLAGPAVGLPAPQHRPQQLLFLWPGPLPRHRLQPFQIGHVGPLPGPLGYSLAHQRRKQSHTQPLQVCGAQSSRTTSSRCIRIRPCRAPSHHGIKDLAGLARAAAVNGPGGVTRGTDRRLPSSGCSPWREGSSSDTSLRRSLASPMIQPGLPCRCRLNDRRRSASHGGGCPEASRGVGDLCAILAQTGLNRLKQAEPSHNCRPSNPLPQQAQTPVAPGFL
jgi:hypothetical protein